MKNKSLSQKWLVVTGLECEALPFIAAVDKKKKIAGAVVGTVSGQELAILIGGNGIRSAFARTRTFLQAWPADHVVSVGTCGSLQDRIRIGDVVGATKVCREGGQETDVRALTRTGRVAVVTVDAIVSSGRRRSTLANAGYDVCEMEAAGVLKAAGYRPFHALKVVSDMAGGDDQDVWRRFTGNAENRINFAEHAFTLCQDRLLPVFLKCVAVSVKSPNGR